MRIILFVLFICNFMFLAHAQKHFSVEIILPVKSIKAFKKIIVEIDNGLLKKQMCISTGSGRLFYKGLFYGRYTTVTLSHKQDDNFYYTRSFFIGKQKAMIQFLPNFPADSIYFSNVKVTNAIVVDEMAEAKRLASFIEKESLDVNTFLRQTPQQEPGSLQEKVYGELNAALQNKEIDYLKTHAPSYYLLWYFKEHFVGGWSFDFEANQKMFDVYESVFPYSLKNTFEGKETRKQFDGKLLTKAGNVAIPFEAKDINGNRFNLSAQKGKMVLLTFWSTTCIPCIAEIPLLKEIYKTYKNVQLVSVALDKKYTKVHAFIKKHQTL